MHDQDAEILKELMLDMIKAQAVIQADQASMKTDLREHMRRTATLETEVKFLHKQVNIAHGAIGLITLLGVIASIYRALSN